MNIFGRESSKLHESISHLKEELEEHLESINDNTQEIDQNHEYLCEVESKIDKLAERLERMQMFLKPMGFAAQKAEFSVRPLGAEEQRVFLALYTIEERKGHVTYHDLGQALDMDAHVVAGFIASLFEKGVPIVKRYVNDVAFLHLDSEFKQLQAKESIVKLDRSQKQLVAF